MDNGTVDDSVFAMSIAQDGLIELLAFQD